jgi:hypothetical protein
METVMSNEAVAVPSSGSVYGKKLTVKLNAQQLNLK